MNFSKNSIASYIQNSNILVYVYTNNSIFHTMIL
jgi:hypothetical protein